VLAAMRFVQDEGVILESKLTPRRTSGPIHVVFARRYGDLQGTSRWVSTFLRALDRGSIRYWSIRGRAASIKDGSRPQCLRTMIAVASLTGRMLDGFTHTTFKRGAAGAALSAGLPVRPGDFSEHHRLERHLINRGMPRTRHRIFGSRRKTGKPHPESGSRWPRGATRTVCVALFATTKRRGIEKSHLISIGHYPGIAWPPRFDLSADDEQKRIRRQKTNT